MIETVDLLTSVIELADAIRNLGPDPGKKAQKQRQSAVKILRLIYFTPNGTRKLLQIIADGEQPDAELVEKLLVGFNEKEWSIERNLRRLDFDNIREFGEIGLRNRRLLEQMAADKINLRRIVKSYLNEPLTYEEFINPDLARTLLYKIDELNDKIEVLESEFL